MVAFEKHQLIVTNAGYPNDIPESLVPKAGAQSTRSFLERRIPTYVQLDSYPVAINLFRAGAREDWIPGLIEVREVTRLIRCIKLKSLYLISLIVLN